MLQSKDKQTPNKDKQTNDRQSKKQNKKEQSVQGFGHKITQQQIKDHAFTNNGFQREGKGKGKGERAKVYTYK